MKKLILSSGHQVKLDDEDYDKVSLYFWRIRFSYNDLAQKNILVVAPAKNKQGRPTNILLPRLVMRNPPRDYAVKFKDGDRLNMQKSNLYLVRYCRLPIKKEKWLREQARRRRSQDFNP
jgi:hypothetical protein